MDEQQAVGPVRVVYESEPRDHGVSARALPSISTGFLRAVFAKLLRTSDDLNSFVLDYFATVHRQFASGLTREAREDLLLAGAPSWAVYEALRAALGSKVPPPPSQADTRTTLPNPYRGLLVFGVQDAPLFFGRAKKTAELRRLFDAAVQPPPDGGPVPPRLVAVIGPSGSGESSLTQAGLLADLLRKPPVGVSYVAAVLRPQGRPLRALARVLAKLKHPTTEWPLGQIDSIVERLRSGPGALGDLVSDVLTEPEQRLLLVVDQLEELYSMAEESEAGTAERRAFVAAVLGAASERRGRLDVVVTLRADLLGEVGADPQLQKALTTTERALLVGALDAEELAEAVAGPAARTGRPLPPDAVALLVREAEGQAGALPLLQFTLEKLWKAIDDAPTRPIAETLEELGGVGGALANEAESLYRGLHPAWPKSPDASEPSLSGAQVRARRTFSRLLQTREGQVLGRRRQTLADLVGDGETLADVRAVLDRFVASRLLVLDGEGAEAMVEIGHESLGRNWQRLAQWLGEAAAYLPVLLRLSEDARRWQKQGQPGWLLWRGDDLAVLRKALPALEANGDLGAGERGFALASVRGARRRQVLAVGGVFALVGALVGVGTLALWAQEQAKQARKQTQVAQQRLIQAVGVADHVVFNVNGRLERVPGMADLRKGLLAEAMKMLDELRKQAGAIDEPE